MMDLLNCHLLLFAVELDSLSTYHLTIIEIIFLYFFYLGDEKKGFFYSSKKNSHDLQRDKWNTEYTKRLYKVWSKLIYLVLAL